MRTDSWVWVAVTAFLLPAPFALLPLLSPAHRELLVYTYVEPTFVAFTLLAVQWNLRRLSPRREQAFWNALTAAFVAWLTVELLYLFYPAAAGRPLWAEITAEILWAGFYTAWLLALEQRAHLRPGSRHRGLEGFLIPPTAALFLAALAGYFWVIPLLTDRARYESFLPSMYLYLTLDLYLAVRALLLARKATDTRWRTLYSLLGAAALTLGASDFFEYLDYRSPGWAPPTALQLVWNLAFVLVVLAARLRHRGFPGSAVDESGREPAYRAGPAAQTLALALVFPWIHVGFYATGTLGAESEQAREILVTAVVLVLGAVALVQHRLFDKRTRGLTLQRLNLEGAVRKNRANLLLVFQRQQSHERLRRVAERFDSFFHFTERHRARLEARRRAEALDALESAVCAVGLDGRVLYWNPSSAELFGWKPGTGPPAPPAAEGFGPPPGAWLPGRPAPACRWTAVRDSGGDVAAWLLIASRHGGPVREGAAGAEILQP